MSNYNGKKKFLLNFENYQSTPKFAKRCENCEKKYFTPYDVQKFLHRGCNNHQILKHFFPKSLVKMDVFLSPNLENIINNDRDIRSQKI